MMQFFGNRFIKGLLTPILAGVVLAILAPFGTSYLVAPLRFMYWIGLALAGGLGAMVVDIILRRKAPDISVWIWAALQSAGATCAVAPFVFSLHAQSGFMSIVMTFFYIWVVAAVITAFGQLSARKEITPSLEPPHPPLLERLPPKFRSAELYAISAEDHYVRIHSAAGEHMLLMRLSDAEDLALPLIGLKPHRSWWVAETGVAELVKSEGKLQIKLKSELIVPVSREGAKRVRKAGWA